MAGVSENGLRGTAAESWNTPEEKKRYQKTKKYLGKNGPKREAALRKVRHRAEAHELEKDRYQRLEKEDWRGIVFNGGREAILEEGFFLTYAPAEKDMREQAHLTWRVTGRDTLLHRHAQNEGCTSECEWIGNKKAESKPLAST